MAIVSYSCAGAGTILVFGATREGDLGGVFPLGGLWPAGLHRVRGFASAGYTVYNRGRGGKKEGNRWWACYGTAPIVVL